MEGNFIKWSNVMWDLTKMESIEMSANDFCRPPKPDNLMFPGLRDFPSVISMCKKFHGRVAVIKDQMLSDDLGGKWWAKINPMGGDGYGICHLFTNLVHLWSNDSFSMISWYVGWHDRSGKRGIISGSKHK